MIGVTDSCQATAACFFNTEPVIEAMPLDVLEKWPIWRHTRSYGRRAKAAALLHVGHMNGFQAVYDRWYYFEWISPKSSDVPCIKVQPDICILYLPANIKENRRIICKVHTRPCARLAMVLKHQAHAILFSYWRNAMEIIRYPCDTLRAIQLRMCLSRQYAQIANMQL